MYLDTSVLTKLFTPEPDSEKRAEMVAGVIIVSSQLAYGELWSALLRKEKGGEIDAPSRHAAWGDFTIRLEEKSIQLLRLDSATIMAAVKIMTELHPHVSLRTLDAIHLATFRNLDGQHLFTADARMRAACRFLELPLVE